jgi:hypothetical protein
VRFVNVDVAVAKVNEVTPEKSGWPWRFKLAKTEDCWKVIKKKTTSNLGESIFFKLG